MSLPRIHKKIVLGTSIIISGLLSVFIVGQKGIASHDSILEAPIFSIEKVSADAGAGGPGGCCCSSCDIAVFPPSPDGQNNVWISTP